MSGYQGVPGQGFAVEEIDGERFLVVKINIGKDGETANISVANPLPVTSTHTRSAVGALEAIYVRLGEIQMLIESIGK